MFNEMKGTCSLDHFGFIFWIHIVTDFVFSYHCLATTLNCLLLDDSSAEQDDPESAQLREELKAMAKTDATFPPEPAISSSGVDWSCAVCTLLNTQ